MTKQQTNLMTAALAALLASLVPPSVARAQIFQWEYINPADPSQGVQQSSVLCPDGAGTVPTGPVSAPSLERSSGAATSQWPI